MSKRLWMVAAVALVALLVAGGIYGSNMGFKLNLLSRGANDGGSQSGTTRISLPYNQQTDIVVAQDLIDDIDTVAGPAVTQSVSRYLSATDGLDTYTNLQQGNNFTITPGEGLQVTLSSNVNYIIVGSHDPTLGITLLGPGSTASGTTLISYPYHGTAGFAQDVIDQIDMHAGGAVTQSISRWTTLTDGLDTYTNLQQGNNFAITPGEAYQVTVSGDVLNWVPDHF